MRTMLAALCGAAAACSIVPPRDWPPYEERLVVAEYAVTDGQLIEVPRSGPALTILEFTAEPAPRAERYRDGRRWLQPPPDCDRFVVRCRYRAYGLGEQPPPPPHALFPGATVRLQAP